MSKYIPKQKITELINITQEELDDIKKNMILGEYKTIFSDQDLQISLLKENFKIYEVVYWFGENSFTETFKEMMKIKCCT